MNQKVSENVNQRLWEKGDFTKIAELMRESGKSIIDSLEVTPSMHVLDLGCGDGTTAIPAAMLGAEVTGIDIANNLVAAGNKRAKDAGLSRLTFRHGDACDLGEVDDRTFDLTLSIFGAMFAPKPFDVAKEMVRVTKPGGRVVMGNWIPNDPTFVSQLLKVSSAFTPPPPEGFVSPMTWGDGSEVVERFSQAGVPEEKISTTKDTYHFVSEHTSPDGLVDLFRRFYGPTMNAFEAAERTGREQELHRQLVSLTKEQNTSTNGGLRIAARFLRVTVNL